MGYNAPSIIITIVSFVALVWLVVSMLLSWERIYFIIPNLVFLITPIEFLSKIFMLGNFWGIKQPAGFSLTFMVLFTNFIIGLLFKFFHFDIFASNFKAFKQFNSLNNKRFVIISGATLIFGVTFYRAFSAKLLFWTQKADFESINVYRMALDRMLVFWFGLALVMIGVDFWVLPTYKILRDVFHISYFNIFFNIVLCICCLLQKLIDHRTYKKGYGSIK